MSDKTKKDSAAQERMNKLVATLRYHGDLYYLHDAPEISDEAYDTLYQELLGLEEQYPQYKDPLSPSTRVGSMVLGELVKAEHRYPQWSFDNVFSYKELVAWHERVQGLIVQSEQSVSDIGNTTAPWYIAELKIDGLKIILDYDEGKLVRAATRGDGSIGEDITEHVKTIRSIPLHVSESAPFSVIGEAWIARDQFENINTERADAGEPLYANPRNLAAGTLRQLDTKMVAERKLQAFVYDIQSDDLSWETHEMELDFLREQGFMVNTNFLITSEPVEIQSWYESWVDTRGDQTYGIDGLVIKLNRAEFREALGYTAKAPRFAVAYKFPAVEASTTVERISFQLGRTGIFTPVADLNPVFVDGSTISRATLHNVSEMKRLDVRIGDTVIIEKAGDIIPKIKRVLTSLRPKESVAFDVSGYFKEQEIKAEQTFSDQGVETWHLVGESDEMHIQKLIHFSSKKGLNIDGLGEQHVRSLYEAGFITRFSDIFKLQEEQILSLPLFKEKATQNLLQGIQAARQVSYARFIYALGIPFVGEEIARIYAEHFVSLAEFRTTSHESLLALYGIGEQTAQSTIDWLAQKENQTELDSLESQLNVKYPSSQTSNTHPFFTGKTFVITGSFSDHSRDELSNIIREKGGKVTSSVSKNTDYLLAGEKAGSKRARARDLGIQELSISEFLSYVV